MLLESSIVDTNKVENFLTSNLSYLLTGTGPSMIPCQGSKFVCRTEVSDTKISYEF